MSCRKDGSTEIPASCGDFCVRIDSMNLRWLLVALFLSLALALTNVWAIEHSIFWRYVWFDVPMHFFGGVALAVFAVGVLKKRRPVWFVVLLAAVFIAWEIFEYVFGVPKEANYRFDTALDFLMDTLGAVLVYGLARMTVWKK